MIGFGNNNGATTGGNIGDANKLLKLDLTGKVSPSAIPSVLITKWVKTVLQNVATGVSATVSFDSPQRNDLAITPVSGVFTINKTGRYNLSYSIKATVANSTGPNISSFTSDLILNGVGSGILSQRENYYFPGNGSQDPQFSPSTTYFLTSGDTLRLNVFLAGVTSVNILGTALPNIFTSITIAYLGE